MDDRVNPKTLGDTPLVEYAARHWVDHAQFKNVSPYIRVAMEYLFDVERPHYAAWLRVHDIDEFWLSFTPDSNIPRAEPLYYAALCGFYDLATHLIAKHPEHVNTIGGQKVTPLAAALYGNHFEVAELLYQHGAGIHVRGDGKRTLLHVASLKGLIDVVRWLLEHGADADSRQNDLFTPLHLAAYNGHLEVARVLLDHFADIHA